MKLQAPATKLQDGLLQGGPNRGLLTPVNPLSGGIPSEADFKFKMHLPVTQKLKEGSRHQFGTAKLAKPTLLESCPFGPGHDQHLQ